MSYDSYWSRLDAIYQGALEIANVDRAAFLNDACGADVPLRHEIEAMLAANALDIERLVRDDDPAAGPDPFIGMRLGAWRLCELIGRGGMGSVYLAERADGQYEQRVALKLIRSSAQRDGATARFKAETHILARLSHPNIARLIDAGLTPEGSAYLVMEHVDGCPVTTYCDANRLTIEQRLRLFARIAAATQHAHQSLVVHLDLKPSNIFVSRSGEVKLLDFGIAKLLEPEHPLADDATQELRALTPAYAAPEQLRGEPVTTAADVYVLGTVLYELLTGRRPAGPASTTVTGTDDATLAPSAAMRGLAAEAPGELERIAGCRGATPSRLPRLLEGDLDRIVLKTLQPDPERRYVSAGQLADDIARLLDGRPVVAHPDSLAYRARRFTGRHRIGAAMTALVCVLVASFVVIAARQARAVAVERDRARLEASRARRASVLVADLFELAEPGAAGGQNITARELLDKGAARISSQLAEDPETQATLFNVVGRLYGNLALHDTAIDVFRRALALEQQGRPDGSLTQAETMHWLAELLVRKNDYANAEKLFRETLRLRRSLDAPAADIAATLEALGRGLSFTGRDAEAETSLREAVDIRRRQNTAPAELMSALNELAITLHRKGDMKSAEPLFREAAEVGRRVPGSSPEKVNGLMHLARLTHQFDRDPRAAEPYYREALGLAKSIYPPDHQDIGTCLNELARDVRDLGRLGEAESLARESSTMFTRLYGARHRETMVSSQTLAGILAEQGKLVEAERLMRESLTTARLLFKDDHPMTLGAQRSLASVLDEQKRFGESLRLRQFELAHAIAAFGRQDVYVALALAGLGQHGLARGDFAFAEAAFVQALDVRRKIHPPDYWRIDETRGMLGLARLRAGRFSEAEVDLLSAYQGLKAHRGPAALETLTAGRHLVELYERWNRTDLAQRYRAEMTARGVSRFPRNWRDHYQNQSY